MAPRLLKYLRTPDQKYMKQLQQPNFRYMTPSILTYNHYRFGGASVALSKTPETCEMPLIKPRFLWTLLQQLQISRWHTVSLIKHMQYHHLPGLQSRLQWYGLQHIYTVSLEDLHTGKRLSSAACLRSGHRQNWQQSKRGSSIGGWSRGKRTHADRSAPRLSIAASNISSWLSLSRFNRSFRTISVL